MEKYIAYPGYKDSGVEWLGNIPSHWRVTPVKYLATLTPKKSVIDANKLNQECTFLPMEKLKLNSIILDEKRLVNEVYDGYTYFENGDVLMAKVTPCFENKNIAVASGLLNGIGFGSSEIYVLRANNQINNRFLYYRLQEVSFMDIATAAMSGAGGLKRVPSEIVNGYLLAKPELAEQLQIANFLDYETAKIDTLIEKQQQLIKLLKEKRQAVISHAVTKGLNAKASIKDSGVEWLGEVPEHWEVIQFRRFTKLSQGLQIPQSERFYELGKNRAEYITIKSINAGVDSELKEYIESKNQRVFCSKEEILLARTGATGEVITGVEGVYHNNFFKVSFDKSYISKDYLFNLLKVKELKSHLLMLAGTTTIPDLNHGAFLSTKVALPPKEEQQVIVNEIIHNIGIYDAGIILAETGIKLLQERRTALISAAVTGKIDVRNLEQPND